MTTVFLVLGVRITAVLATSFFGFLTFLPCLFIPLAIAYLASAIRLAAATLRHLRRKPKRQIIPSRRANRNFRRRDRKGALTKI